MTYNDIGQVWLLLAFMVAGLEGDATGLLATLADGLAKELMSGADLEQIASEPSSQAAVSAGFARLLEYIVRTPCSSCFCKLDRLTKLVIVSSPADVDGMTLCIERALGFHSMEWPPRVCEGASSALCAAFAQVAFEMASASAIHAGRAREAILVALDSAPDTKSCQEWKDDSVISR